MNSSAGSFQGICLLFRNIFVKKHLSVGASGNKKKSTTTLNSSGRSMSLMSWVQERKYLWCNKALEEKLFNN